MKSLNQLGNRFEVREFREQMRGPKLMLADRASGLGERCEQGHTALTCEHPKQRSALARTRQFAELGVHPRHERSWENLEQRRKRVVARAHQRRLRRAVRIPSAAKRFDEGSVLAVHVDDHAWERGCPPRLCRRDGRRRVGRVFVTGIGFVVELRPDRQSRKLRSDARRERSKARELLAIERREASIGIHVECKFTRNPHR